MRARRKSHVHRSHPRRAGMKGDWIVLAHNLCPVVIDTPEGCDEISFTNTTSFTLVDAADVTLKEDALTLVRTIGDIGFVGVSTWASVNAGVAICTIDEGIYKSQVGAGSNQTRLDPRSASDAESDAWMWRRRRHFATETLGLGPKLDFWTPSDYAAGQNNKVDIRVARKVIAGESILYTCGLTQTVILGVDVPTFVFALYFDLRGYVKF